MSKELLKSVLNNHVDVEIDSDSSNGEYQATDFNIVNFILKIWPIVMVKRRTDVFVFCFIYYVFRY